MSLMEDFMKRLGKQTVAMQNNVYITNTSSVVGKKEGEGPLSQYFDYILEDEYWGEKTFEKTENSEKLIHSAENTYNANGVLTSRICRAYGADGKPSSYSEYEFYANESPKTQKLFKDSVLTAYFEYDKAGNIVYEEIY
jgi:hypothetical protein